MNRLGWSMLTLFVLLGAGFALIVRNGGTIFPAPAPVVASGRSSGLIVPVAGIAPSQLTDTWGQSRGGGLREHHAIDIMAPRGTPVLAAAAGTVEKIFESRAGGHTIYVRLPDDTIHYYAHLDAYAADVREGGTVTQGQQIATVGFTGSANPAGPHLHFEIKRMQPGEKWWQGTEVNPYPILTGRPAI